jgi:RNA methyltransferase, TrmH family
MSDHRAEPITQSLVQLLRELIRNASTRNEEQRFVVEGPHLLEEALKHKASISLIAATDAFIRENEPLLKRAGGKLYQLSAKQAERVSDTEAPQGVFTLIDMPKGGQDAKGRIVLMLDEVQDPGNVGTLIRTAAWFGVKDVLLGKGTADLYNPKVIRGTQGAIFAVNAQRSDLGRDASMLRSKGYSIVSTTLSGKSVALSSFEPRFPLAIVLGSEARGVRKEIIDISDVLVHIPKLGSGESLNVAVSGGIVMSYLASKQTD